MAYVYRHIRLDKNIPFYIGISADTDGKYARAYKISRDRSYIWKRIVAKTKFEVEILMDGLTWDQACEKEKEFIKLYGRINTKTGILANLTDGGEGNIGVVITKENRDKLAKINSKPIAQYSLTGKFIRHFDSSVSAASFLGISSSSNISACCNNKKHTHSVAGFIWKKFNEDCSDIIVEKEPYSYGKKSVSSYDDDGRIVKKYLKIADACEELHIMHSEISRALKYKNIKAGGFFFRYGVECGDKIEIKDRYVATKRVIQINPIDKKEVKKYSSIIQAAIELNIHATSITACCKGKLKTSGNFVWKYVE